MFLLAAMGPPGGGRMVISRRLQSRFNLINMTFPQVLSLIIYYYFNDSDFSVGESNQAYIWHNDQPEVARL